MCDCIYLHFHGKISRTSHIYLYIRNISTFYCRVIDGLFSYGREQNRNKKQPSKKFEFTYSKTSITFLDTKIYKNQNGILCTTIYRKPNDSHNFLHYDPLHSKSLKDAVPFSQSLRIRRICSENQN